MSFAFDVMYHRISHTYIQSLFVSKPQSRCISFPPLGILFVFVEANVALALSCLALLTTPRTRVCLTVPCTLHARLYAQKAGHTRTRIPVLVSIEGWSGLNTATAYTGEKRR